MTVAKDARAEEIAIMGGPLGVEFVTEELVKAAFEPRAGSPFTISATLARSSLV